MASLPDHRHRSRAHRRNGIAAVLLCGSALQLVHPAFGQSAPFQMLPTDVQKYVDGAAVPGPFQVTAADVASAVQYSSGMTASGPITENANETVIFTGSGSAGTANIITNAGGAARFYDNATAADALITNNGTLQFSGDSSGAQAQIVTNEGSATVYTDRASAGATNSATLTNNGVTVFLDKSGTGASKVTNNGSGELHFANDATIGNALENSGLAVLSDNVSLGSNFVVNNTTGKMVLRGNTTAATADIANSGTLVFAGASTADASSINNNAAGVVAFVGASSAGDSSRITNDGALYFGDSATAGSSTISTQAGGQTILYGAASGGTAAFKVDSGGVLDISLLDTAGTSVGSLLGDAAGEGSRIYLGDKSLTIGSNDQSTMVAGLWDGGLSGKTGGLIVKVGMGELELAGSNNYTGETRVEAGRLKAASEQALAPLSGVTLAAGTALDIGAWDQTIGALAGDGTVILGNADNQLNIGGNNTSSAFAGSFEADGGIVKTGTGTLTLTGISTNTGDNLVNAGTLRVDGSLVQSDLTVAGGTLSGSGIVGQTQVLSGGTINPGGGRNLTIAADLVLDAGSTYRVDLTRAGADSLTVAGNASFDGATLAINDLTNGSPIGSYVILSAGSTTGQFAFEPFDYAFLVPELDQTSNIVTLTIARNGLKFSDIAETPNQRAAATALDGFAPTDPVFAALLTAKAGEARRFYELADGEIHAAGSMLSQQAFALFASSLTPSRVASLSGVVETGPYGASVATSLDVGASVPTLTQTGRVAPLAQVGKLESDGNGGQVDWTSGGLAAGGEITSTRADGHTIVGVGVGTIATRASIDERLSSLASEGYYAGIYGQWRQGPVWLDGRLAYGASNIRTTRTVELGEISRTATADYWAQTLGLGVAARYEFELAKGLYVGPVASVDVGWSGHDGATESGAGSLNQTIAPSDSWLVDTGLGLAARYEVPLDNGASVAVTGKAMWQHSFGDSVATQTVSLEGGGGPFIVSGPDAGRDRLRLNAGVEYRPNADIIVSLDYTADISELATSHAARVSLKVRF